MAVQAYDVDAVTRHVRSIYWVFTYPSYFRKKGATKSLLLGSDGVSLQVPAFWEQGDEYPMDYYSKDGGEWNSTWHRSRKLAMASKPNVSI